MFHLNLLPMSRLPDANLPPDDAEDVGADVGEFEEAEEARVMAALWRGGAISDKAMSEELRDKLAADAAAFFAPAGQSAGRIMTSQVATLDEEPAAPVRLQRPPAPSPARSAAWTGWLAAAGLAVGFFVVFAVMQSGRDSQPVTFASLQQSGRETASLKPMTPDNAYARAEAETVWDEATQTGVLRVRNLPTNDATQAQYQLWIVDATLPDGLNRVDGGVFDVTRDGWSEIPITAKVPVGEAAGFAITLERPGGVVVSELGERLLMMTGS